jgi:hypothetical protein
MLKKNEKDYLNLYSEYLEDLLNNRFNIEEEEEEESMIGEEEEEEDSIIGEEEENEKIFSKTNKKETLIEFQEIENNLKENKKENLTQTNIIESKLEKKDKKNKDRINKSIFLKLREVFLPIFNKKE